MNGMCTVSVVVTLHKDRASALLLFGFTRLAMTFKEDPRWQELYNAVKAELSGREHVERGRS